MGFVCVCGFFFIFFFCFFDLAAFSFPASFSVAALIPLNIALHIIETQHNSVQVTIYTKILHYHDINVHNSKFLNLRITFSYMLWQKNYLRQEEETNPNTVFIPSFMLGKKK